MVVLFLDLYLAHPSPFRLSFFPFIFLFLYLLFAEFPVAPHSGFFDGFKFRINLGRVRKHLPPNDARDEVPVLQVVKSFERIKVLSSLSVLSRSRSAPNNLTLALVPKLISPHLSSLLLRAGLSYSAHADVLIHHFLFHLAPAHELKELLFHKLLEHLQPVLLVGQILYL